MAVCDGDDSPNYFGAIIMSKKQKSNRETRKPKAVDAVKKEKKDPKRYDSL